MRLQIYVSDFGATGVVRNAIGIANAATEQGFDVRILTCIPDGELRGELSPGVTVVDLLPAEKSAGKRKKVQKRALLPYKQHISAWRPDVLLSAGNHGHRLSSRAWAGAPGCKVLRISNAVDQVGGGLSWFQRLSREWKFHIVTGQADRLVLVSHALARHPLLGRQVKSGKAVIIPNGVDVERVRAGAVEACPHPWLRDRALPVVLAVGRHVPQKNLGLLLEGFALARQERRMRLLFLGAGTASVTGELRSRGEALGIADDMAFEQPVPNPFPYMAAASVFALPSLWEGSSNVLLEALACGTPVIASPTAGDAALILGDGRFGLLADPTDPRAWSDAILRQLSNEQVLPGERAEDFSRKAAIARYLALFREWAVAGGLSGRP